MKYNVPVSSSDSDTGTQPNTEPQQTGSTTPYAWWLSTRRRRSEWQTLTATGTATFTGQPRRHFTAARPGDPVLMYVSRPDHAIRAVGVVVERREESAESQGGDGKTEAPPSDSQEAKVSGAGVTPALEVQLAFELPTPLAWREIASVAGLSDSEPVRQRSSGTLFGLTREEYDTLQGLIVARNPEMAAAFGAVDAGDIGRRGEEAGDDADFAFAPGLVSSKAARADRKVREGGEPYRAVAAGALPPVQNLAELAGLTGLPVEALEEARDLLEDTGQIILSGPPGTGKTWLARGLAALVGCDPGRVQVVQFHPSTAYEDFIEGLKPRVDERGQVSYAVLPGIFVRMCEQAKLDPDHHYVLLIDEINRAPLSRVFGELLYSLEYRGPEGAVELSASAASGRGATPFYVPENLLIIGTMNSADRSIALVDYALRRRFRFIELEPNSDVLDGWLAAHGASEGARRIVLELFESVNSKLEEQLDRDHRLGHSYFMLDAVDGHTLDRLWRTSIRPLIAEYFTPPAGEIEEYAEMFGEARSRLGQQA